jgi:hypothetical protein
MYFIFSQFLVEGVWFGVVRVESRTGIEDDQERASSIWRPSAVSVSTVPEVVVC